MTGKVNVGSGTENTQDRSSVWFPKLNRFTQQKGEETKKHRGRGLRTVVKRPGRLTNEEANYDERTVIKIRSLRNDSMIHSALPNHPHNTLHTSIQARSQLLVYVWSNSSTIGR